MVKFRTFSPFNNFQKAFEYQIKIAQIMEECACRINFLDKRWKLNEVKDIVTKHCIRTCDDTEASCDWLKNEIMTGLELNIRNERAINELQRLVMSYAPRL